MSICMKNYYLVAISLLSLDFFMLRYSYADGIHVLDVLPVFVSSVADCLEEVLFDSFHDLLFVETLFFDDVGFEFDGQCNSKLVHLLSPFYDITPVSR